MNKITLSGAFILVSIVGAHAEGAPIDFSKSIADARGVPMTPCEVALVQGCSTTPFVLGEIAAQALNAPVQDSRGQPVPLDTKNTSLAWHILSAAQPLVLTDDEKTRLKGALYRSILPGAAYAACRMIEPTDECDK